MCVVEFVHHVSVNYSVSITIVFSKKYALNDDVMLSVHDFSFKFWPTSNCLYPYSLHCDNLDNNNMMIT